MNQASDKSSLKVIVENIFNCLDAHSCTLFIANMGKLHLLEYISLSDSVNANCKILPGQGPVGWVFKEQRPMNIARYQQDGRETGYYKKSVSIGSLLAVPLPHNKGVLCVDSKAKHFFTEKHQKLLMGFSYACNHLLEESTLRRENELLSWICKWQMNDYDFKDALSSFMKGLSYELCFICRRIQDRDFYVIKKIFTFDKEKNNCPKELLGKRFRVGQGMAGWMFKHKRDLQAHIGAKNKQFTFLFEPKEDIPNNIDSVLGLFYPARQQTLSAEHLLIFAGDSAITELSDTVITAIKTKLGRIAPWP